MNTTRAMGCLLALTLWSAGCASAQRPRRGRCPAPRRTAQTEAVVVRADSTSGAAVGTVSTDSIVGPTTSPPPPSPAPVAQSTSAASSGEDAAPSEEEAGDCEPAPGPASASQPGDAVASLEAQIERERQALAAGLTECRDICRATGNICTAASEICRLTGAEHARCARARGHCTDAGRRRDGACAVCPPAR